MRSLLLTLPVVLALAVSLLGCGSAQPYQGMGPEGVMELGLRHFEEEDWDDAIAAFERVLFSFPDYQDAPVARFHIAESYFEKGDYLTAVGEYTRMRNRFPRHELAPRASLGVCRSYVELSPIVQRDQTHEQCRAASLEYPGSDAAQRAAELRDRMWAKLAEKIFIGGKFYYDRDMYDSAIIYFEDVWENYPDTPAAPKAIKYLIQANETIGYGEEAEQWKERLLTNYPDSPQAEEIRSNRANGV